MKTEERVAGKFMKAKGIEADYGDVDWAFNVMDFFEGAGGGSIGSLQVTAAQQYISQALSKSSKDMGRLLKKELSRHLDNDDLEKIGLKLR